MIDAHFAKSVEALEHARASQRFMTSVQAAADACCVCLRAGGKLLIAGNGGSAGDAQHIAGEFVSRLNFDRAPLAAIALTTDTSVLTSVGNDYGFERIFERQVLGLGRPKDVLIAMSTSGRSPNILRALEAGRSLGLVNIGIGAESSDMARLCELYLGAPSNSTPLIQQITMVAAHALCGAVEREMFRASSPAASAPNKEARLPTGVV